MSPRWPGWDGWLLIALDLLAVLIGLGRGLDGVGGPLIAGVVVTGLALATTYWLRRSRRAPSRPVREIRILTVVPTKDNAGSIADVIRGCRAHTEHLLMVDDGSTDGSGALAAEAGATVITHDTNLGKGAALETALDWAYAHGFSHIVAIDADGQHEPDDLPSFFDAIRMQPGALIAGVRDMSEAPRGAVYARANSNFWVWVETGQRMGDTQCGYRAYPVGPTRDLGLVPSRYQWEVEVLVRSVWAGTPVIDHPCRVFYPPADERVSSYRKIVDTARITWLNAHLIAERLWWPPRWFPGRGSWQGNHRGFTAGWRAYLWVLRTLGPGVVRWALVPLVVFYWIFLGAQRDGLIAYLKRRRPERGGFSRHLDVLSILLNFAWSLVDRFHVMTGGEGLEIDRSAVPDLQQELFDTFGDKGLVLVSGHLGNADLGGAMMRGRDRNVHLLLYQAPTDPYFVLMQETLGDRAPNVIALNDGDQVASLAALRALKAGDVVAAKGDRIVDGRTATTRFLGEDIEVPTGPLLLAALARVPVVFIGCFQTSRGRYRIEADGPHQFEFTSRKTRNAELQKWAQHWTTTMERWTETYPLQWYNFFDPWSGGD